METSEILLALLVIVYVLWLFPFKEYNNIDNI